MGENVKRAKKEIIIAENRDFKGIWIPEKLYLTREFTPNEKFLLIEIYSLTKKKNRECFASNKHFADFVGLKENTIQKMLLKFENTEYIRRDYEFKNNGEIERRTIKLTKKFYDNFINETDVENSQDDGMDKNPPGSNFNPYTPVENNPSGDGLKVGDKYSNNLSNTESKGEKNVRAHVHEGDTDLSRLQSNTTDWPTLKLQLITAMRELGYKTGARKFKAANNTFVYYATMCKRRNIPLLKLTDIEMLLTARAFLSGLGKVKGNNEYGYKALIDEYFENGYGESSGWSILDFMTKYAQG